MARAPLGEEVGDLEVGDIQTVAHLDPAVQLVKAEGVFACAIGAGNGNIQELGSGALTPHSGIQSGGEQGGQKEVDAVVAGGAGEVLHDLPVPLGPGLAVVVVGQAVAMEPLGQLHLLGGELGVQHLNGQRLGGHGLLPRHEADGDGIGARGNVPLGVKLDPDGAELVLHDRDDTAVVEGLEPVGVEAGLLREVVIITDLGIDGVGHRHQLHGAGGDILGRQTLDLQSQHGAEGGIDAHEGMKELEGEPLVLHHADEGEGTVVLDTAVQEGLFQRGNQFCLDHGETSFRRRGRGDFGGFSIAYFGGEVKGDGENGQKKPKRPILTVSAGSYGFCARTASMPSSARRSSRSRVGGVLWAVGSSPNSS